METYTAVDYHTAGEPFRIVTSAGDIPGATVADRRMTAINDERIQRLRQVLCHEPRGHADMYGGFIVPGDDAEAHFGVLFWHKDGFSTACGHGTIALGAWAVENGIVDADPDGTTEVVIDVPSGRVRARVRSEGGVVQDIDFVNVASQAVALDVDIETSAGPLTVDVGYGGAVYAHVKAADLGLSVVPERLNRFIELGREIRDILNATSHSVQADSRLSGIYGVVFYDDHGDAGDTVRQTNVTIFANGQVDRSPCGSGTASRLAVLSARGRLAEGRTLQHRSIVGSKFSARVLERVVSDGVERVVPLVTGTAFLTGRHEFLVDGRDDLVPGFVLR